MSITLPNELAQLEKAKVVAGDYAMQTWLQSQVAPAYDALAADPSRVVPAEDVRAMLAEEHKRALRR